MARGCGGIRSAIDAVLLLTLSFGVLVATLRVALFRTIPHALSR